MIPTVVNLSHIHEVETVVCDNPSCCCEGDTCETYLTSLFKKKDDEVFDHVCAPECSSCLCSVVKKLEESTAFTFSVVDEISDEEVYNINPEIAIDRHENEEDGKGEPTFYSSNMTFKDIVRSFKVKEIKSIRNYVEFHAHTGVTCGGCMNKIHNSLNEKFKSTNRDFFVRWELQTRRVDIWSNDRVSRKEIKKILPEKFSISFYSYFEIQGIHCGGCEAKITEKLDLNKFRSFEFTERKYLRIESDRPLNTKKVNSLLLEINKPGKTIPKPLYTPLKKKEEEEDFIIEEEKNEPLQRSSCTSKKIVEENIDEENEIEIIIEEETKKRKKKKTKPSSSSPPPPRYINTEEEVVIDIVNNQDEETSGQQRLVLQVGGMTCGNCALKVSQTLNALTGVTNADVVVMTRKAFVEYDPKVISEESIMKSVNKIGFTTSKLMEVSTEGEIILCLRKTSKTKVETVLEFFQNETETDNQLILLEKQVQKKKRKYCYLKTEVNAQFKLKFEGKWTPRRIIRHVSSEYGIDLELEQGAFKTLRATLLKKRELRVYFCQFMFSLVFTLPAMIFALFFGNIHVIGGHPKTNYEGTGIYTSIYRAITVKTVVLLFLCTPVQIFSGYMFYKKAAKLLIFDRSLDKNTLITISCWVAYTVSIISVVWGMFDAGYIGKNYMEGSAMLICFLLLGQWLENVATRKTSMSLVKLMKLQPDKALLCTSPEDPDDILEALLGDVDNPSSCSSTTTTKPKKKITVKSEEVDVNLLWPGDIVEVKIGCKIPTDGLVVHGSSEVNQAMVTGESVYVSVGPGTEVIGGTVNISHPIFVKITKSTQNNMLSKIVKMIEEAEKNKPKIQDVLDKIAGYFVPVVCCISIVVLVFWLVMTLSGAIPASWLGRNNPVIFSILQATSTLVVACPCTLGLAVPLVIMVANGIGAKYGVIVKGGHSFEKLVKANIICFDKTGTLTQGKLSIAKVYLFNRALPLASLMSSIGACELSIPSHPIAQTIIEYVKEQFPDLESLENYKPIKFEHVNGQGLKCEIKPILEEQEEEEGEQKDRLLIGNLRLLENNGVVIGKAQRSQIEKLCAGKTRVFVSLNEKIVAIFTLVDQLRPEIKKVVTCLRKNYNLKVMMLTGDHDGVALKIGRDELGMEREDILSELTPIGKAETIRQLQRKGKVVVFVGDGVNDSVGLSQADVGISLKSGTEIAIECSNIVLMKKTMLSLLLTFHLSRRSYRRIQMNVFWAFLYNVITIPIAAGLLFPIPGFRMIVPPWVCAVSMTLSCLSVTFNTLLFRCVYRPPKWMKKAIKMSENETSAEEKEEEEEKKKMMMMKKSPKQKKEKWTSSSSDYSTSEEEEKDNFELKKVEKEEEEEVEEHQKLVLFHKEMVPSVHSSVNVHQLDDSEVLSSFSDSSSLDVEKDGDFADVE